MALLLGVETSCDESSAAVVRDGREILSQIVLSQDIHGVYGGVVPELASREHIRTIGPVIRSALREAGAEARDLEGVAVTVGPGLIGSLVVGLSAARAFAWSLRIPLLPVHHLEAHLYALRLAHPDRPFEFVGLIVSGGHTEIVDVRGEGEYELLGATRDDAAGEAFDKVAKMTDLPYPGGPSIDRLARAGERDRFSFPRAKLERGSLDFGFSGVKTAVRYALRDDPSLMDDKNLPDLLAGFQEAVVGPLVENTGKALERTGARAVGLCGGVAANSRLREAFAEMAGRRGAELLLAPVTLCTDNAAMVAAAGEAALRRGRIAPPDQGASADIPLPFRRRS
ncbi:MAG: tRNA (adenosine(37)-N6)-threonylcarbamoyltransferase complex transferase subunit TsaD [Candidatus Eisenbacteria bacterium]